MLISALTSGWRGNAAPAAGSAPPKPPQETAPAQQIQPVPAEDRAVPVQPDPTPQAEAGYDPDTMARAAAGRSDTAKPAAPRTTPAAAEAPATLRPVAETVVIVDGPRPDEEVQARDFAEAQLRRDRLLDLARTGYGALPDLFRPAQTEAAVPPVAERRAPTAA